MIPPFIDLVLQLLGELDVPEHDLRAGVLLHLRNPINRDCDPRLRLSADTHQLHQ